jgi:hypothetical protein
MLFDPEDEGHMFLRNVGPSPNYTVLQRFIANAVSTSD